MLDDSKAWEKFGRDLLRTLPESSTAKSLLGPLGEGMSAKVIATMLHPVFSEAYLDADRVLERYLREALGGAKLDEALPFAWRRKLGAAFRPALRVTKDDGILHYALQLTMSLRQFQHGVNVDEEQMANNDILGFLFLHHARWASFNFPTIRLTSLQACALALSDMTEEQLEGVSAPWPAFFLLTEDAFVSGDDPIGETMVARWSSEDTKMGGRWHLGAEAPGGATLWHHNIPTWDLFHGTKRRVSGLLDLDKQEEKVLAMLGRATLNLCEVLSSSEGELQAARERKRKGEKKRRVKGGKAYSLSLSVKVDMRQHVRDYLSSDASRVYKVRWVVRGHWRMQACGPQRSLRKKRWIEPHWKGPERGDKRVREHQLTDRKAGLPEEVSDA